MYIEMCQVFISNAFHIILLILYNPKNCQDVNLYLYEINEMQKYGTK